MKIFNKVIWNTDPPVNKSDIWYDGKTLNVYKGDIWTPITSDLNVKFEDVASDVEVVKFPVLYYNTSQNLSDGSINQVIRNLKLDTRYLKLEDYEGSFYDDSELKTAINKKVDSDKVATINGKSIINGGNIEIESGEKYDDTEIRKELSKKVDADKVATINGQSLVEGGNIVIPPYDDTKIKEELKTVNDALKDKVDSAFVNDAISAAITETLNEEV